MTTFAQPHDPAPSIATTSSALPPRARVGGALALSTALHVGIAALLLFAAWSLREDATRDESFTLVPPAGDASTETVATMDTREGSGVQTRPNFLTEMNLRQRAEERRAQLEIERMREQRRAEEARHAIANTTPRAERAPGVVPHIAATPGHRVISHAEFQRSSPASRTAYAEHGPAVGRPAPTIDWRKAIGAGDDSRGPGSAGPQDAAMKRAGDRAMERYFDDLIVRLRAGHEKPEGLSDLLSAEVEFTLGTDGTISAAKIVRSSGDASFDRSVLVAVARVRMPARPDGKRDAVRVTFRMREG